VRLLLPQFFYTNYCINNNDTVILQNLSDGTLTNKSIKRNLRQHKHNRAVSKSIYKIQIFNAVLLDHAEVTKITAKS
jgi:hypothetical protein